MLDWTECLSNDIRTLSEKNNSNFCIWSPHMGGASKAKPTRAVVADAGTSHCNKQLGH